MNALKIKKTITSLSVTAIVFISGCFSESPSVPDVTPEKFAQIQNGMKYKEVTELLGSRGHQDLSQDAGGVVVRTYSWPNSKGGWTLVIFNDDTVIQTMPGMSLYPPLK